jgi:hypothetical protein
MRAPCRKTSEQPWTVLCDAYAGPCSTKIERANLSTRCVSMLKQSSGPVPEGCKNLDGPAESDVRLLESVPCLSGSAIRYAYATNARQS